MRPIICDLCDCTIKDDELVIIGYIDAVEMTKLSNSTNLLCAVQNYAITKKEVCTGCKEILDFIFLKRREGVKLVLDSLKKQFGINNDK